MFVYIESTEKREKKEKHTQAVIFCYLIYSYHGQKQQNDKIWKSIEICLNHNDKNHDVFLSNEKNKY